MKPRIPGSNKWTPFPKEYIKQIQEVFHEAFAKELRKGNLVIEGKIFPKEVMLRVGYLENGRLQQANFEVSMIYSTEEQDTIDRIYNCIDAAASLMNEYFEAEGEVEFPLLWKEYDFSGKSIWVQYSTVNSDLETQADDMLGSEKDRLLYEEPEKDDALEFKSESIHVELDDELAKTPTSMPKLKKNKNKKLH